MTFFVIALIVMLLWYGAVTNHIPKTGREGISSGDELMAVITNHNKGADRAVTLRAAANGRRFKVKMKSTEAHLWVKGDEIRVLISKENPRKYRICFNDYFRDNEQHIRDHSIELLQNKVKDFTPAAKSVKYDAGMLETFKNSKLSSQRIFAFVSMMKMIDSYIILVAVFAIACIGIYISGNIKIKALLVPALAVALIIWYISSAVKMCTKIMNEAQND